MQFFADTADLKQIREINRWFPLHGVTTNPTLVAQSGEEHHKLIQAIAETVKGPVSAEVLSTSLEGMLKEARTLADLHPQVVVKLPMTKEGLQATRELKQENIPVNVTLCFSTLQALAAARAGAHFVSPFVGRLDDIGVDGMEIVSQIVAMFSHYQIKTKVLVASVRHLSHVLSAGETGADIVTLPPSLFSQMVQHPLTDKGLARFLKDARNATTTP